MPNTQSEDLEEKQEETPNIIGLQSKEDEQIVQEVWNDFYKSFNVLQTPFRYFRDRTLIEYIDDQNKRLNDYFDSDETKQESWEPEFFDPITREKIRKDLSKLCTQRIKAEIVSWDKDIISETVAICMDEIMDETNFNLNEDENLIYEMFQCKTEGTVIGYEGFRRGKRDIEEITEMDLDTGEIKKTEKKTIYEHNDVYGCIVSLGDFFPANIFERSIQEQPYLVWRKILKWDSFKREFADYKKADLVLPRGQIILGNEPFFGMTEQVGEDEVEVLRYYNKRLDRYLIIANGILLTSRDNPLPFNHKQYPFWKAINEPFAEKFFYGKGDPDLFMGLQDVNNQLLQMVIAQAFLAIYKPFLTEGENDLSSGYLVPGRMTVVDNIDRMKELEISAPSTFYLRMIQMVQGRLNNLTADIMSSSGGGAKTAHEVSIARNIALELVSLFLSFMEFGYKSKFTLRLANMFQFYTMPIDVENNKPSYRKFTISSGKLMFGGEGVKIIKFTDEENMPLFSPELASQKKMIQGESNIFKINVNKLKNFKAILKIIPRSSVKETEAVERALELEYVDRTMGNPLFDQQETAKSLAIAFKKDPQKALAKQQQQMPGAMGEDISSQLPDQMMRGIEGARFKPQVTPSINEIMGNV